MKTLIDVARDFLDEFKGEFENNESINGADAVDKWAEYRQRFYDALTNQPAVKPLQATTLPKFEVEEGA